MTELCALRAKAYSFLINEYTDVDYEKNKIVNKKAKGTKKCIIKRELMFENYKDSLFNDKIILRSQHRFRSDIIMCTQKRLIKKHLVVMMIKVYRRLIKLLHIHMVQMFLRSVKMKCC